MNLDESLERLFHRNLHLVKLDLEPMRSILELLGNPHQSFLSVHVAGTNGKGSVCAMLASMLQTQGYRTGLYTSPHLIRFNERIRIDGEEIDDGLLQTLIDEVEDAAAKLQAQGSRDVTFFEFTTALAFLNFQRSGVEIAVVETGMGGRLDATNVLIPAVSVITSIGLEHQKFLGDTLEKIAGEKAGIIKPGRPVVVGPMDEGARAVVLDRAREHNAPVRLVADAVNVRVSGLSLDGQNLHVSSADCDYGKIHMRICGLHQAVNAAVAVCAAESLNRDVGITIREAAIKEGLAETHWPARCELVSSEPPVIVDGAHNPHAADTLSVWIGKVAKDRPLGMIVSFLVDKEPEKFMRAFGRLAKRVWLVPIQSEKAMPVEELAQRLSFLHGVQSCGSLTEADKQAHDWAGREGGLILVTGSLYLAGEYLHMCR